MNIKHLIYNSLIISSFAITPLVAVSSQDLISMRGGGGGDRVGGGQEFHGGGEFGSEHPAAAGEMGAQHEVNKDLQDIPLGGYGGGGNSYYLPPPAPSSPGSGPGMSDDSDQIWQSYQKGN